MTAPVSRIKKLLRLSRSSNPHEAASARAEADRLMRAHGVRVSLEETERVTEVVEQRPDEFRTLLARDIAASRGCKATKNSAGWIGFQGTRANVDSARRLYEHLTGYAHAACEGGLRWWSMRDADDYARSRFWTGFVVTMSARLPVADAVPVAVEEPVRHEGGNGAAFVYVEEDGEESGDGGDVEDGAVDVTVQFTASGGPASEAPREPPQRARPQPPPAPPPVSLRERAVDALRALSRNPNAGGIMRGIEFNAFQAGRSAALGVQVEAWAGKEAESGEGAPVVIRGHLNAG